VKRKAWTLGVIGPLLLGASNVLADPPAATLVPAGAGQAALAARVVGEDLVYKACRDLPCDPSASDGAIRPPAGTSASSLSLEVLAVGEGRHVLWAHAPSFGALVAALPGTVAARVLWSGRLGLFAGEPGERHGDHVQVTEAEADGTVRVLVGEVREDVSICGRTSILSPRVLSASDFGWKAAMVQRLTRKERDTATRLTAAAAPPDRPAAVARLLQGVAASSGIGLPAALTDGDPNTTWSEQRGGDGRGEFVQMNAPEQAQIRAITFVLRPPERDVPKGAAPSNLWLATGTTLFSVTFPEDGWAHPGAAYEVRFPEPIRTRCLALVLDEAYAHGRTKDVDVTIAEVTARTEFDDTPDPDALAGALAGGSERSRMAAAILTRAGARGSTAVIDAYPKLDDLGRVLALEVIDNAPCETSVPLYVRAMAGGKPGEVRHSTDRVLRCGRSSAPALGDAITKGSLPERMRAAALLAMVAPDLAVPRLVDLAARAAAPERLALRAALARAAQAPGSGDAIKSRLSDPAVAAVAQIDLLRAVSPRSDFAGPASEAIVRLAAPGADVRTRYLLLGPAAGFAVLGDARLEAMVARALSSDAEPHVRARAAEAAAALPKLGGELARALGDAEPRVRDAALASLSAIGGAPLGPAVPAILDRLATDPWTFVRVHAAEALAVAPAGGKADETLAETLAVDASAPVRARIVEALGKRGARSQVRAVRGRLEDTEEDAEVRVAAAVALGRMCDAKSVDALSLYVQKAAIPGADGPLLAIGIAAASALGRLDPPDLTKRLAPLEAPSVPTSLKAAAARAHEPKERCAR
jgi:hypothetical protein